MNQQSFCDGALFVKFISTISVGVFFSLGAIADPLTEILVAKLLGTRTSEQHLRLEKIESEIVSEKTQNKIKEEISTAAPGGLSLNSLDHYFKSLEKLTLIKLLDAEENHQSFDALSWIKKTQLTFSKPFLIQSPYLQIKLLPSDENKRVFQIGLSPSHIKGLQMSLLNPVQSQKQLILHYLNEHQVYLELLGYTKLKSPKDPLEKAYLTELKEIKLDQIRNRFYLQNFESIAKPHLYKALEKLALWLRETIKNQWHLKQPTNTDWLVLKELNQEQVLDIYKSLLESRIYPTHSEVLQETLYQYVVYQLMQVHTIGAITFDLNSKKTKLFLSEFKAKVLEALPNLIIDTTTDQIILKAEATTLKRNLVDLSFSFSKKTLDQKKEALSFEDWFILQIQKNKLKLNEKASATLYQSIKEALETETEPQKALSLISKKIQLSLQTLSIKPKTISPEVNEVISINHKKVAQQLKSVLKMITEISPTTLQFQSLSEKEKSLFIQMKKNEALTVHPILFVKQWNVYRFQPIYEKIQENQITSAELDHSLQLIGKEIQKSIQNIQTYQENNEIKLDEVIADQLTTPYLIYGFLGIGLIKLASFNWSPFSASGKMMLNLFNPLIQGYLRSALAIALIDSSLRIKESYSHYQSYVQKRALYYSQFEERPMMSFLDFKSSQTKIAIDLSLSLLNLFLDSAVLLKSSKLKPFTETLIYE